MTDSGWELYNTSASTWLSNTGASMVYVFFLKRKQ